MRIFVSEYLTSGACPEVPLDSSLMREGRLMSEAILADLEQLNTVETLTTRDSRLEVDDTQSVQHSFRASTPNEEQELFEHLTLQADAVLIIAPETDNLLEDRIRRVMEISDSVRILNCDCHSISSSADKLALPARLHSLPTSVIPAAPIEFTGPNHIPFEFPVVVKPRFGAGSEETYCIETDAAWNQVFNSITERHSGHKLQNWVIQPYVQGISLSSVAVFRDDGSLHTVLPLGRQSILQINKQLSYRGGEIPWISQNSPEAASQNGRFFTELSHILTGLRGYVGADWIWDEANQLLHLVEINPRLTTSYLGYRELYGTQIAAMLLDPARDGQLICDEESLIGFDIEGNLDRSQLPTFEKSGDVLP